MLALIIGAALLIISMETPLLIRQKKWKELALFSGFLISGLVLGVILAMHIVFPNPVHIFESVFKPVTKLLVQ